MKINHETRIKGDERTISKFSLQSSDIDENLLDDIITYVSSVSLSRVSFACLDLSM